MRRWSKLQKRIYAIVDLSIDWQIHCVVYRYNGWNGVKTVPRYFITLDGRILFDCPKDYPIIRDREHYWDSISLHVDTAISRISNLLEEYLNAPSEKRLVMKDPWGIIDIVRAADRRIGKRRWHDLFAVSNDAARQVLIAREIAGKQH